MSTKFSYARPYDIAECMEIVRSQGSGAYFLAGGTDVMLDLRSGELSPEMLVDLSNIPELKEINLDKDHNSLVIGAGVTVAELLESQLIYEHVPSLHRAAQRFAGKQIRNAATIGGNVAHCSPCADTLPPLLVHEAKVNLIAAQGKRKIDVHDVAKAPYKLALSPQELLVSFELVPRPDSLFGFEKIGRRKELAIARVNMAVLADLNQQGTLSKVRFALGSCTPVPQRFENIESLLEGSVPEPKLIWETGRQLVDSMLEITGRRPSFVYKEKAVQGLFYRMMTQMVNYDTKI